MKFGNVFNLGLSYLQTDYIYTRMNDLFKAKDFVGKAMKICKKLNDTLSIAEIYKVKGIFEREGKNYGASENYLITNLRKNQELKNKHNEAEVFFELSKLYNKIGKAKEEKAAMFSSYQFFKGIGAIFM
ncbi:MAG: hypothetical protein ACYC6P_07965 [Ignavibacteriaceae bacterium]